MSKKLDVVIVCDGYGDFLEHTLPYTKLFADDIVVVTGMDDKYTEIVCKKNDVTFIKTYVHKYNDKFNKALAINHGLAHLGLDSWVLQLDADIIVPPVFRKWFSEAHLIENRIYGVDRFDCNFEQWTKLKNETDWLFRSREWGFLIHPPSDVNKDLKLSCRVGHKAYHGAVVIGFFQLFNAKYKNRYPTKQQADMEHTDLLHSSFYPPENRYLIPDFFTLHLTTDKKMGINWKGRQSKLFGKPSLMGITNPYGDK